MRLRYLTFSYLIGVFLLMSDLNGITSGLSVTDAFERKSYTSAEGKTLPYRICFPKKMIPGKRYPLVIFFHGAGERGADNERQMKHGVPAIFAYTMTANDAAIILVPQCPEEKQWVDVPWGADSHLMPAKPSETMALAIALIQATILDQPVDAARVYVTGVSMGGFGTWDILQRMPALFAGAVAVCGGGDTQLANRLKDIPIWAFHGDADTVVKTQRSRDMIVALKVAGGEPRYTEYEGVGHDSWTQTYRNGAVLEWLFSQRKP